MVRKINKTVLIATMTMALTGSTVAQTDLTGLFDYYQNDDLLVNTTNSTDVIVNPHSCLDDAFALDSHYDIDLLTPQATAKDDLKIGPVKATLLPEPATVMMLSMGGLVFIRKK